MRIELRRLSPDDGMDIYRMLQEISPDENGFVNGAHGKSLDEYGQWLLKCDRISRGVGLEDWMVPQDVFWLYVDDVPVGMGKLRHWLTDRLRTEGGHAGYAIRPTCRKQGYGKLLLGKLIDQAKLLGIDRLLITVHNQNAPSIKVARACGGIVERVDAQRHYIWIDVSVHASDDARAPQNTPSP